MCAGKEGGGGGRRGVGPYVPWRYPNNPGLNKASS